MHALAFEMLDLEECVRTAQSADKGIRILDIGCGSGYLLAAMHRFIQANLSVSLAAKSLVVGVDHVVRLTSLSRQNLLADGLGDALNNGRIIIETADGRLGSAHYAGFDAIHVGAAAQDGVPPALLAQLNAPGRLVLPLGTYGGDQVMTIVKKDAQGFVTQEKRFGVRYVPLC
jgi:protein-L-isoaspartate(D-aspartate) O-methyltransferase